MNMTDAAGQGKAGSDTIEVLIVEDVGWQLDKIREEVGTHGDMRVIAAVPDIEALVTKARQVSGQPGGRSRRVAVIDLLVHEGPPGATDRDRGPARAPHGLGVPARLRRIDASIHCLAFSQENDRVTVREALQQRGFNGYLVKDTGKGLLAAAVRTLAAGQVYIDPRIGHHLVGADERPDLKDNELKALTLLAQGSAQKDIAVSMVLSDKQIGNILRDAREVLGVKSNTEAVVRAMQRGLINP